MALEDIGSPRETRREREFDYNRTVALSDGVFAIALTLLILNVDQPSTKHNPDFWATLNQIGPDVGAYALSFAVLGLFWLRHHAFFRDLKRIDARTAFLNLVYLGIIAFIPFPTSLLADQGHRSFSVVAYAATLSLAALVNILIRVHAGRAGLIEGLSARETLARPILVVVVFALSIPIAFAAPDAAEWFWVILFVTGVMGRGWSGSAKRR